MNNKYFCFFFCSLCLPLLAGCSTPKDTSKKPQKKVVIAKNGVTRNTAAMSGTMKEKSVLKTKANSEREKPVEPEVEQSNTMVGLLSELSDLLNGKEKSVMEDSSEQSNEQADPTQTVVVKSPEEQTKIDEEVRTLVVASKPFHEENDGKPERKKKIRSARIVDEVEIGDDDSEREHLLQGVESRMGISNEMKWRGAEKWFSYEMKVLANKPMQLICTYWGDDTDGEFDILIDGDHVATQRLKGENPDQFVEIAYRIPEGLTARREKVVVKFQTRSGNLGAIYGCRLEISDMSDTLYHGDVQEPGDDILASFETVVDSVEIADDESERQHNLQGEGTSTGPGFGEYWRHAYLGKWFSYEMKVFADKPMQLVCRYWGGDGEPGGTERTFDIMIDGTRIATQTLAGEKPDRFFEIVYPIPKELTTRKEKVAVRFQAHENSIAGGVYGCRMTLRE